MARPKKKAADRRTDILRIRLTDEERAELDHAAKTIGLDTSTWGRVELLALAKKIASKHATGP
jgi:hypothetical protein